MNELLLVAGAGFCASLVDGALGMGFGPTSASILLGTGLAPASVSTTVNLAKVVTGVASAVSHWRFRNIDHRLVVLLAGWGMLGAVLGVAVLSRVDGAALRPALGLLLLVIGLRILLRYRRPVGVAPEEYEDIAHDPDRMPAFDRRGLRAVAAAGGVTNGLVGAWGPVVTPVLMHRGLAPRFAVGSVNTAEVAVATVSATSLVAALGSGGIRPAVVVAMLLGGVAAAPVAAWVVRHVPARPMGLAVSALILTTSIRELAGWAGIGTARWGLYATVGVLVALAAAAPHRRQSSAARTAGGSSRLASLPVGSRGSSSTTTTDVGHLKWAMRSRQNAISSSASSSPGVAPGSSSTTARTASPISGSGTPMTATSATDGCATRASSTSRG